jgi:hypothetical protein
MNVGQERSGGNEEAAIGTDVFALATSRAFLLLQRFLQQILPF